MALLLNLHLQMLQVVVGSTHVGEPASRPIGTVEVLYLLLVVVVMVMLEIKIMVAGGGVGAYNSVTYTVVNTTDYLVVTVGAGGAGDAAFVNSPGDNGGGGAGARGVVRLQGAT